VAANATSIVPASGSIDTSSQPSRTAEGGGAARPSIASQNGPSRVTYLFYQSIPYSAIDFTGNRSVIRVLPRLVPAGGRTEDAQADQTVDAGELYGVK
jgi:hypothetical protein